MSETIFHKIIRKEIPAKMVHEDDLCVAFHDINPVSPYHVLVVPKTTIPDLNALTAEDDQLVGHLITVATRIAKKEGFAADGYRLVINCGENGNQTVMQLHVHLIGGRAFGWPPG